MDRRRRFAPMFVVLAFAILGGVNIIGSPRFANYRAVDIVYLLGTGMCFGAAIALFVMMRYWTGLPSTLGTLIDFTPVDLHLSAWYGEAGVRFTVQGYSQVRPYAEATGGFARMHTAFSGAGAADPFVATALRFLDRTEPMLGVGAGVAFTGGPVTLDLGYRYKRILASDSLPSLLVAGDDIDVSQVRIGIGFRF